MTPLTLFDIARAHRHVKVHREVAEILRRPGHKSQMARALAKARRPLVVIAVDIARENGLSFAQMTDDTRARLVSHPRQDFMRAAWKEGYSTPEIGAFLGMDHSTVVHGIHASEARAKARRGA